jgi:hypothetical protein
MGGLGGDEAAGEKSQDQHGDDRPEKGEREPQKKPVHGMDEVNHMVFTMDQDAVPG